MVLLQAYHLRNLMAAPLRARFLPYQHPANRKVRDLFCLPRLFFISSRKMMTSVCRGRRRDTHYIRRSFRLRSQIKRERIRGCIPPLDGVLRRGRRLTNSQNFVSDSSIKQTRRSFMLDCIHKCDGKFLTQHFLSFETHTPML